MNLRIDEDHRNQLFLAINRTWNFWGYVFTILPKNRDLACITIQHLLCKLHYNFPDATTDGKTFPSIDKFVYLVAEERAQETTWDASRNCAVAINTDSMLGTLEAMKNEDYYKTLYNNKISTHRRKSSST
jgi:hypothetical protein